jgi:hypothetical protein
MQHHIEHVGPATTASSHIETLVAGKMRHPITARLKNVDRAEAFGKPFLMGEIYGDRHGRFVDGKKIHTSFIVRELAEDVFETQGGDVYRVVNWLYPQRDPGDENDFKGA